MRNFVNDKDAIGHWKFIGDAETKEDALSLKVNKDSDFEIKDLYLMEGGREYWVLGWTKGKIFINGYPQKYEIVGDHMIVAISYDEDEVAFYAVFKRVDNLNHTREEFMIVDNINLPFVNDAKAIGAWETVDYVDHVEQFVPGKRLNDEIPYVQQLSFVPNGELFVEFYRKAPRKEHWTKSHILFEGDIGNRDMKYEIFTIDGQDYMSMEWKSGDYIYGGKASGYYILKRK